MVLLIGGGFSNEIYEFNPQTLKTALKANMDKIRTEHSSVLINSRVYILGGFEKKENAFLSECEIYDCVENKMRSMASMKIPKCGFSCAYTAK